MALTFRECCCCPFWPAIVGTAAFFCSVLGSFLCEFVSLKEINTGKSAETGIWMQQKLYLYEGDGGYGIYRGCGSYPGSMSFDANWKASKSFSVIASVWGAITLFFAYFAFCLPMYDRRWKMVGVSFVITSLFQGLTLLFLNSDACGSNRGFYNDLQGLEFESGCDLSTGAYVCISATVLWFVAGVLVCQAPNPSTYSEEEDDVTPKAAQEPASQEDKMEEPQAAEPAEEQAAPDEP